MKNTHSPALKDLLSLIFYCLSFYAGIILLSACSSNKTYYIDSINGKNNNSGISKSDPWKNLSALQNIKINPGDKILLKRGSIFCEEFEITAEGTKEQPIIIESYGNEKEDLPRIVGNDESLYAVKIFNSDFLTLRNIEIINTGEKPIPGRTGLKIECKDYGISNNIVIDNVTVRDVNGSLVKNDGGGSGILIVNGGDSILSRFDNLRIENCHILRCTRNAIIWNGYYDRRKWFPNRNTIIRNNLIEGVPGDGIVPIGCDSTLIEYNIMRDCPDVLPMTEAAAGIWPWSCDNTTIQFNEVYGHKAPWDAQGFDADYNCNNTIIQYNYSHDNYGGLVLVCNNGFEKDYNSGNRNSIIRYNISIGDGIRPKKTRQGMFSPAIHIAGSVNNTIIERNIVHLNTKESPDIDNSMIVSDCWGGFADSTVFRQNLLYSSDNSKISLTRSTNNIWEENFFIGKFDSIPEGRNERLIDFYKNNVLTTDKNGYDFYHNLMDVHRIKHINGHVINKDKIESFWNNLLNNK